VAVRTGAAEIPSGVMTTPNPARPLFQARLLPHLAKDSHFVLVFKPRNSDSIRERAKIVVFELKDLSSDKVFRRLSSRHEVHIVFACDGNDESDHITWFDIREDPLS